MTVGGWSGHAAVICGHWSALPAILMYVAEDGDYDVRMEVGFARQHL